MTQKQKILNILRQEGSKGLNSYEWRHIALQLPTRIFELKQAGYLITEKTNHDRSVNYFLIQEPTAATAPQKPNYEEMYNFTNDGRAVLREEPKQEVLW